MFRRVLLVLIFCVSIFASACGTSRGLRPEATLDLTQVARAVELTLSAGSGPEDQRPPTALPSVIPTRTPLPSPTLPSDPTPSALGCEGAAAYEGQTITCQISRAHCNYRPDINGSPTFCNDRPFPDHDFTLLVWGQDWSDYDGLCVQVSGEVVIYQDKPQIVAESRSQVVPCP